MAFNLPDAVQGYLTPHLLNKTSGHFGEFTSNVAKASTAAVPAVLSTFIYRAEEGGAQELLRDARKASDSNVLNDPDSLVRDAAITKGWETFTKMTGKQSGNLVLNLASLAGIKTESAQG